MPNIIAVGKKRLATKYVHSVVSPVNFIPFIIKQTKQNMIAIKNGEKK